MVSTSPPLNNRRTAARRQKLSPLNRKPKRNNKVTFVIIGATSFFITILGVWVFIMYSSLPQSPQSQQQVPTKPQFHQRENKKVRDEKKVKGGGGYNKNGRSLRRDEGHGQHERTSGSGSSRKPRVVGIYAYHLNNEQLDDWNVKREERIKLLPPYVFLTERIDPYLLSHTSQTLRRIRAHDYYPDNTSLPDVVKNYRLAIAGSTSYIKSEDPLKHLMLSSTSRDTLNSIHYDSEDYEEALATPLEDEECEATPQNAKWMLHSFPTCNFLHENDWVTSVRKSTTKILGNGYWRDVWPVLDSEPSTMLRQVKVALKTMRYEHEYTGRNFHRHVRDAIVSERLTSSPMVTDIYAFCGNSGYFEFATGGSLASTLEKHYVAKTNKEENESMGEKGQHEENSNDDDNEILDDYTKLSLAHQVAAALADFHDADALRDENGEISSAAIVHADITTDQYINIDGVLKLNDFNRCRFMRQYRDSAGLGGDGKPCGFHIDNNPAKMRSPEEYAYEVETEKIDVYSMGNIFYSILTDLDPWEDEDTEDAQKAIMKGDRPWVTSSIKDSKDAAIVAMRKMMHKCWEHKPEDRPRARYVADYLSKKLSQVDREKEAVKS